MPKVTREKINPNITISENSLSFPVSRVLTKDPNRSVGRVIHKRGDLNIQKEAGGMGYFPPFFQTPLTDTYKYYQPGMKEALNKWYRYYYNQHHLVGPIIDTHCELPLSRFSIIGVKDPWINRFYQDLAESIDILELFLRAMNSYYVFGEATILGHWDDDMGAFVDADVLNPDYISAYGHPLARSSIVGSMYVVRYSPDPMLKKIVSQNDDSNPLAMLEEYIPEIFLQAAEDHKDVLLDPFSCTYMVRGSKGSDIYSSSGFDKVRGTSAIQRVMQLLLFEQKMRGAMFSVLDSKISPKVVWKLGTDKWFPEQADYDSFFEMLQEAENDPSFEIITHNGVNIDVVGTGTQVMNLEPSFERVENGIITGLMANKAVLTGEGPTYHNASVAMRALMSRYLPLRDKLEDMWRNKFWLPSAIRNGFVKIKPCELSHKIRINTSPYEKEYIVPGFQWERKATLLDDPSVRNLLMSARNNGDLPFKVVCDNLGLDYIEVQNWQEKEEGTIFDKPVRDLRAKMITNLAVEIPTGKKEGPRRFEVFVTEILNYLKKAFIPASKETGEDIAATVDDAELRQLEDKMEVGMDQYGGGVREPSRVKFTETIDTPETPELPSRAPEVPEQIGEELPPDVV